MGCIQPLHSCKCGLIVNDSAVTEQCYWREYFMTLRHQNKAIHTKTEHTNTDNAKIFFLVLRWICIKCVCVTTLRYTDLNLC